MLWDFGRAVEMARERYDYDIDLYRICHVDRWIAISTQAEPGQSIQQRSLPNVFTQTLRRVKTLIGFHGRPPSAHLYVQALNLLDDNVVLVDPVNRPRNIIADFTLRTTL
jgi:hypothetical protein